MRIGVLGPLELRDEAGSLVPVGGARLRSLLIRLAIGDGRPVSVERLAADLWADGTSPADAANAIQALVSRLRNLTGRDSVEHGPAGYRLTIPPDQIDASAFERLVAAARGVLAGGDHAAAAAMLAEALSLWRGPALADVADAPFAAAPVTRLSELRLAAIEDRVDAELALGPGAGLIPELQELAAAHPLRERLRGQLMRALYGAGRQADALTAYEDIRALLVQQLGVDPSPGLAAVHLAILRGDPQLAGPARPAETAGDTAPSARAAASDAAAPAGEAAPAGPAKAARITAPHSNLPAQLTSFVGRDEELRRLGKLLGESRLVSLTGPGGAGKTRLAVEAAARMADQVPDGVWFVALAPVRDALDVPQAVLAAIGAQEPGWLPDPAEAARLAALSPIDRLADTLAHQQLILVLDNCEHLVSAVAWLADHVLTRAPGVRILATTREPLGITGETLCPVPSLELPPEGASAEEAPQFPAVRLFADRAAAVRPGFGVDLANVGPVLRICRALDGIPLAIELAAARLRALTPAQVADRLDDRFRLLSVGSRTALPRHQTLRAIVDWSWELLDETERTVLRRLAVFAGGATPESAEPVCGLGGDSGDVIDVIAALVDKSLVTATGEQEVRYWLLETVRAYAADRLAEAGEADRVRDAHAEFFVTLAERAEPRLRARDQVRWLNRLSAEHDNCAAALRHAVDTGQAELALRFVAALSMFWLMRDYDAEAGEWAAAVRQLAGDTPPPGRGEEYAVCQIVPLMSTATHEFPDMARLREVMTQVLPLAEGSSHPLLALTGPMLALFTGDLDGMRRSLDAAANHPDPWLRAAQRMLTGQLAINDGDIEAAAACQAEAKTAFGEIGDRWGLMVCLTGMAEVEMARNRPAEAVRLLQEARAHAADGLAVNFSEMMCVPLGRARARAGDAEGARADLRHAIAVAERIGEHDDEANGYLVLSELAMREGDLAGARGLVERALKVIEPRSRQPGMQSAAALAYSASGCIAEQDGDIEAARRWHAQALATLNASEIARLPMNPALAAVVEGVAATDAARGEHARSAELLGLAHTLRGYRDELSLSLIRASAANAAALGEADAAAAYERGRALSREDALAVVP